MHVAAHDRIEPQWAHSGEGQPKVQLTPCPCSRVLRRSARDNWGARNVPRGRRRPMLRSKRRERGTRSDAEAHLRTPRQRAKRCVPLFSQRVGLPKRRQGGKGNEGLVASRGCRATAPWLSSQMRLFSESSAARPTLPCSIERRPASTPGGPRPDSRPRQRQVETSRAPPWSGPVRRFAPVPLVPALGIPDPSS